MLREGIATAVSSFLIEVKTQGANSRPAIFTCWLRALPGKLPRGPMGSLPHGKWTTDPPKNPKRLWVWAVEILLAIFIVGGALYSQGVLKIDITVQPGVEASPTPTATLQPR